MTLVILTGTFKNRPNLKNNVAYGSIKTDKMFLTIVAFGEVANEVAKCNTTDTYLIEGRLSQSKYNNEWRFQVVINSIKPIVNQMALPLEEEDGEIASGNLEDIDMPTDDLPF